MSKDEVDIQRARHYAWTLKFSDETELEEDAEESAPPSERDEETDEAKASSGQGLDAWRFEIHAKTESLAAAVERVWNGTTSDAQQARQVKSLVASAAKLGLGMIAMSDGPLGLVRLARLVNRHWHRLSAQSKQEACGGLLWSQFEPSLAVDLLVEICRDGNTELAGALYLPLFHGASHNESKTPFLTTGLAAQLITLLEAAETLARPWESRLIALDWLRLAPARSAVPVVRRMLRLPHLELRWHALALLLKDYTPSALLPEDVLFLLQDLLAHPPDSVHTRGNRFEVSHRYSYFLQEAVETLRPEGGGELLAELAFEGDYLRLGYEGHWEGKWALVALSAAYAERALPLIDRCMRSGSAYVRTVAVEAAAKLPEELARCRLTVLATDGDPSVAEGARDHFIKRFATACPVEPLDEFPVELLVAPPSERLHGRLLCLRSPSIEARAAMVEVLLDEAPCSEALALLTFALCDDDLLRTKVRRRLPKDLPQMCARLYRRFGGPAIAALCWLVDRYPEAGLSDWLYVVSRFVAKSKVRKRDLGPLRSLAARWLDVPDFKRQRRALQVLADVGAPAELMERLLTLAWLDEPSPYWAAMEVLKKWPADKTLDARILKVAQDAWANREVHRLECALTIGFHRRIPPLDQLAEEILAAWLDYAAGQRSQGRRLFDPLVELPVRLANQCVSHLRNKEQIDNSTLQKWLTAPEAPAFLLATRHLSERNAATKRALFAALKAPSTPREAAQEAAAALLLLRLLHPDDPRLHELLGEATHHLRFWVMYHIGFGKCRNRTAHRLTVAALLKAVPASEEIHLRDYLPQFVKAVGAAVVKQALTELPDRDLRNRLLAIVYAEEPQSEYWQDVSEVPN